MKLTIVVNKDGSLFGGYCVEVPGSNGQGETEEECVSDVIEAARLLLEYRREEAWKEGRHVLVREMADA